MASRRFFAYDPYDYYYTTPYNYPYPYYHHLQQPAPATGVGGFFFPAAADAEPTARAAAHATPRSLRSVSIPVQFVGSDPEPEVPGSPRAEPVDRMAAVSKKRPPSAEEATVRLQAASRGFLARKSVRAVREVEREAEEVEGRVARDAEALRGDARARVTVGEALMRLLLRLDAVRGAREYRRRVTKRVLALQDAVDALEPKPAATPAPEAVAEETEAAVASELPGYGEHGGQTEPKTPAETTADMEVDGDRTTGEPDAAEETEQQTGCANPSGDSKPEGEWEMVTEETEPAAEVSSSTEAPRPQEPAGVATRTTAETVAAGGVDQKKVLEMVAALCERSAQQYAVIGALAERVDALERTVRRVEDAERRRRRGKKLRKEGKGSSHNKCYID